MYYDCYVCMLCVYVSMYVFMMYVCIVETIT